MKNHRRIVSALRLSSAKMPCVSQTLKTEEFMVPAIDRQIKLYVRNKYPASISQFPSERIVLFVHGSTFPAESVFDLSLNGMSWMDYIAGHGYDVYFVDLRGYGRSTRPTAMDQPADKNPPLVRTESAVQDVSTVVDFIRKRRGVDKINLLGWSWGATIMATYATRSSTVRKLVLLAPAWIRNTATLIDRADTLGAYRVVQEDAVKTRWLTGVPEDKTADLIPTGWFEACLASAFACDPWGAKQKPRKLRVPNGTLQDTRDYWSAGRSYYEPEKIRVPALIMVGEWDQENPPFMAQAVFGKLINTPYKQMVQIDEATHTMMLEKNRMQVFRAVQAFLDDAAPRPEDKSRHFPRADGLQNV